MTTQHGSDEQTRVILDELRLIRKSIDRVYMVVLIPVVLGGVFVAGTILRLFFP